MQENITQQLHDLSEFHQNSTTFRIRKSSNKRYVDEESHEISDWSQDQDHYYYQKKLNPEFPDFKVKVKKDTNPSQQKMCQTARKLQFRAQSCQLKPVKIKFGSSQILAGFHKSFYQKSFKQGISPSNYTSVYEQYRMRKQQQKKQRQKDSQKQQHKNKYKYQSALVSRILSRKRKNFRDNSLLKDYILMHQTNLSHKK